MDAFTNFLANNYVWFLIISLILIFALIGYLVDAKEIKTGKREKKKKEELKVVDFSTVDQSKSLNDSIKEDSTKNLNLDAYVKKSEEKSDNIVSDVQVQELETLNLDMESNELPDLDFKEDKKFENEFQVDVNE